METHEKREVGDAEGDQVMTAVEVEQNHRKKEKKKKKKEKMNLQGSVDDKSTLMACNSEVEEDGKEEDIVDDIEEMEKERKAEKERKKEEKRDQLLKQMDEAVVSGDEGRKEKKRKRKEKKTKGDTVAGDEEQNVVNGKKEKKKKGEVNIMEAGKEDNKERKRKRKEKETNGDTVFGDEEPAPMNDKKEKKKGKVNIMEAGKADDKENKVKEKKKEKEKKTEAGKEAERDARKKRKLDKGDADTSEHVIPKRRAKKVKFSDEVTDFPPPSSDEVNDSDKKKEGLVQGKRYTKEEDEKIRQSVFEYIELMQLGEEGLNMVLYSRSHPQVKGCWKEIQKALPHRPYISVYHRAHTLFERSDKREWTKEDIDLLRELYKKYGPDWKSAAAELKKFRIHVKDAFRRYGPTDRKKGHWSQEEYQTLFEQVNKDLQMKVSTEKKSKHGMLKDDIGWAAISVKLGTRDNATCCRKWYGQLTSPLVEMKLWADVDDYLLLMELVDVDASCEEEVDWDNLLEHRSGDIIRKRWNQMVLHLGEHGNKSFSEQVEVLSNRYCPDLLEVREALDARPIVD